MTFEEVKNLLADVRHAKQRARAVNARIAELYGFGVSIKSSLSNGIGRGKGTVSSPTEELAVRILTEQERLATALERAFNLEDKLLNLEGGTNAKQAHEKADRMALL